MVRSQQRRAQMSDPPDRFAGRQKTVVDRQLRHSAGQKPERQVPLGTVRQACTRACGGTCWRTDDAPSAPC